MKAGIAIDEWKLDVFKRKLEEGGYTVVNAGHIKPEVLLLTVEYTDQSKLHDLIVACNHECARSKLH